MGDILDIIKSRRTIKYYLPKFISWENVSRILDAGRHAPSSGNIQCAGYQAGKGEASPKGCGCPGNEMGQWVFPYQRHGRGNGDQGVDH